MDTKSFTVKQDGGHYDDLPDLNAAIELAEQLLGAVPVGVDSTFTIENQDGYLLASVTNRRIIGTFYKQKWGGRKGDDAIACGETEFDATDAVLLMDHSALNYIQDNSEESDALGMMNVSWDGPCSVHVQNSISAYFGVSCVEEITPEALAFANRRLNPQPAVEESITLIVKVAIRVMNNASVTSFVENLDYKVISNTVGIVVTNTEIVDLT